jgi:hypothetical protein
VAIGATAFTTGFGGAPIPRFSIPIARFGKVFFLWFGVKPSRLFWILVLAEVTLLFFLILL